MGELSSRASPPNGSPYHLPSPALWLLGHPDAPREGQQIALPVSKVILMVNLLGFIDARGKGTIWDVHAPVGSTHGTSESRDVIKASFHSLMEIPQDLLNSNLRAVFEITVHFPS